MLTSPALRFVKPSYMPKLVPSANCVLWLPGQDDPQSSTIRDRSGYGNNGTIVGAGWKRTGQGLWYLDFDGSDDKITITDDASLHPLLDSWTIKVWFKISTDARQFLVQTLAGADAFYLEIYTGTRLRFAMKDSVGGSDTILGTTIDLHDGKWHQGIAVRNEVDSKLYLYLDGVSDATAVATTNSTGLSIAPATDVIWGEYDALDLTGGMALMEMIRGLWTATQVGNSYNQERHLFGV